MPNPSRASAHFQLKNATQAGIDANGSMVMTSLSPRRVTQRAGESSMAAKKKAKKKVKKKAKKKAKRK